MRMLFFIFFLVFFAGQTPSFADQNCATALRELFSQEISTSEAKEFLSLQARLTIHRLAWVYLKKKQSLESETPKNIERVILQLLEEKSKNKNAEFVKARNLFQSQPLSRNALAAVAPYLKDILLHEFDSEDRPFLLDESDVKLLSIASSLERKTESTGQYDTRMLDEDSAQGVTNFLKLINASYRASMGPEFSSMEVEVNLKGIERTIQDINAKMMKILDQFNVPQECTRGEKCQSTVSNLLAQNEGFKSILMDVLQEKLRQEKDLIDSLRFRKVWLRVFTTPPKVNSNSSTSGQDGQGWSAMPEKLQPKTGETKNSSLPDTGVVPFDPIATLIKDNPVRTKEFLSNLQPGYVRSWAKAVAQSEKVFSFNGRLYSRDTGRALSEAAFFEMFPPEKKQWVKSKIASCGAPLRLLAMAAIGNRRDVFVHGGHLYDVGCNQLDPSEQIANKISKTLGQKRSKTDYSGMESEYLVARAEALMNDSAYFTTVGVGNQELRYETLSGRRINPNFNRASTVKIDRNKSNYLNNLDDHSLIREYFRINPPTSSQCQQYTVLDKENGVIQVYQASTGARLYEQNVLIGAQVSDDKTYWAGYQDGNKEGSGTTGAGIFTVRDPKTFSQDEKSYYQKNYNGNLISFGERVFALHQVPNGMEYRNGFFDDPPSGRRKTGGCVNVKKQDFAKVQSFLKPGCQLFVLPETGKARFKVVDGKINLVQSKGVKQSEVERIALSQDPKVPTPIEVKITNREYKNYRSSTFMDAIRDEKPKLMSALGVTNEVYNQLAQVAFGILGQESDFGNSLKYKTKEEHQGLVILGKMREKILEGENPITAEVFNTSRGLTQIKMLPEKVNTYDPKIKKETLGIPRDSAIATMFYLAEARRTILNSKGPKIKESNWMDYIPYVYTGRVKALSDPNRPATPDFNEYVQNMRRFMDGVEILTLPSST
ncbi:MAG: hypothetical protein KGP28_01720 [Bdellovibrionales bacterium]|nr:hypothetical protein [Bdellovibrionales bacterium]